MKIVIGSIGTRGDVQPCIALGVGLAAAGFEITIATHPDYEAAVQARGLGFRAVGGSFKAIAQSDLGREWLESGSNPLRYAKLVERIFVPLQQGMIDDADRAVEGHDALVYYPLAVHFLHAAERRRLPAVAVPFIPWVPTGEIRPLMLPQWFPTTRTLSKRVGELTHSLIMRPFHAIHAAHRERTGLAAIRAPNLTAHAFALGIPHVHLVSPAVLPRPTDWPSWASVSGFCFLDETSYQPSRELAAFLSAGPPPVYVGFGSMTGTDPEGFSSLVEQAVLESGHRALIAGGWGGLQSRSKRSDVFFVDEVPHDWLLPRVSAVVHHGGVGTLAAGLRAGRPTVVVPFFGDQPFWGRTVRDLGVGPAPIPRGKLSVPRLAAAIGEACSNDVIRWRAAAIGQRIAAEDGVARTAEMIARFVS